MSKSNGTLSCQGLKVQHIGQQIAATDRWRYHRSIFNNQYLLIPPKCLFAKCFLMVKKRKTTIHMRTRKQRLRPLRCGYVGKWDGRRVFSSRRQLRCVESSLVFHITVITTQCVLWWIKNCFSIFRASDGLLKFRLKIGLLSRDLTCLTLWRCSVVMALWETPPLWCSCDNNLC